MSVRFPLLEGFWLEPPNSPDVILFSEHFKNPTLLEFPVTFLGVFMYISWSHSLFYTDPGCA